MSYTFKHIAKDRYGEDIMEVIVMMHEQNHAASEVVENFVYFLQGCGFFRESILSAMYEQAEELKKKDEEA